MPSRRHLVNASFPSIFMVEHVAPEDRQAVVAGNIMGTAFVLDEANGWLVTAKHVVEGRTAANIRVRSVFTRSMPPSYALGTHTKVEEIKSHPSKDIALLRMHRAATRGRGIAVARGTLSVGEDVLVVGFAGGTTYTHCDDLLGAGSPKSPTPIAVHGIVAALVPHDGRPVQLYVTDTTIIGGNSGGPVIGVESGEVVGLLVAGGIEHGGEGEHQVAVSLPYGYALPITSCSEFLDEVLAA
jgi:S1-C subfamily serine protease